MVLAHAFGERYDLPIPLLLFVLGGALVVVASFLLVFRQQVERSDAHPLPDETHLRPLHPLWAAISVAVLAGLVAAGLTGSQEVPENILPTSMWVLLWVAVPLSCGLLGDWTQVVNPFAHLAKLADSRRLRNAVLGSPEPVPWPIWLGWWPAVVLFFLGGLGELVFNLTLTLPNVLALTLLSYAALCLLAGLVFGRAWVQRGEAFSAAFATWGRLGYFRFGAPGHRGFAGGLDVPFEPTISRVTFVLLLLVSVSFDGLLSTPRWNTFERRVQETIGVAPDRLEAFRTLTFAVLVVLILAVFGAFAVAAARAGRHRGGFLVSLAGLLPSVLPIAFGYQIAHYVQYLAINSQLMFPLLGNPVGKDWWPLHLPYPFNDDYEVKVKILPTAVYWYVALIVIVAVHIAAVVIAHRHLAREGADERLARRSEYPWLVAMVAYTMLSLWLLAQPLTKEKSGAGHQEEAEHHARAVVTVVEAGRR